jgi:hypothetical protein
MDQGGLPVWHKITQEMYVTLIFTVTGASKHTFHSVTDLSTEYPGIS